VSLEHAILGFLAERPRTGYDLKTRCFDGAVSAFWTADQAQIYRTLERLARGKAVAARRRRQAGRPDRLVYELTPIGRERLAAWVALPQPPASLRDPFLVQLWFAAEASDDEIATVLAEQRDAHQARLESLRALAAELTRTTLDAPDRATALRRIAVDGAIAGERAAIDWLDDAADRLACGLGSAVLTRTRKRHG